jgi:hypothetical protein
MILSDARKYMQYEDSYTSIRADDAPIHFKKELLDWLQDNNIEYSIAVAVDHYYSSEYRLTGIDTLPKTQIYWYWSTNMLFLEFFNKDDEMLFKLVWG